MAETRPKDLLPTAESMAEDDYLLLDGATKGTRKLAALSTPKAIAEAATIDWALFINGVITLNGNQTLGLPLNGVPGQWRYVDVLQDEIGNWSLSFADGYEFPGGIPPVVAPAPSARSKLCIFCRTTSSFELFAALDIRRAE